MKRKENRIHKTEEKRTGVHAHEIFEITSIALFLCVFVAMRNYAKQSQFPNSPNERKPLWKKGLRKRIDRRIPQKQTQTKPISDYPCVFELAVYNLFLRDGNVMHSMPNGREFDGEYSKWQRHRK